MAPPKLSLRLREVPVAAGMRWVRQGLALWARSPMALGGLFVAFMLAILLLSAVLPMLGGVVGLGLLPLLTLAYVLAGRAAAQGRPVHVGMLVEGLRDSDPPRRRALLNLCLISMVATLSVLMLADAVDDGAFRNLQVAMAEAGAQRSGAEGAGAAAEAAAREKVGAALADPRLAIGMLIRFGLTALLAVPFWHAPPLIHFGAQGALQAMFSSTVAVWRARGAFLAYGMGWATLAGAAGLLSMLVGMLSGSGNLAALLLMPLALALSAAFYSSLWFVFVDSFAVETRRDTDSAATIDAP